MSASQYGPLSAQKVLNAVSATNGDPSAASDGVAVPARGRHEHVIFHAEKTNTLTVHIWGYSASTASWADAQTVTFSASTNEAEALQGLAIYDRLYAEVTAIGGGSVTAYFLFPETGY